MLTLSLALFSIGWVLVVYVANCLIAHRWLTINPSRLLIYITTMAALGLFGEVAFDTIYNFIFGVPLWEYQLLPIHSGYTSLYSLYLWGTIGFHLYLLHGTLERRKITSIHALALLFCAEAILLEALVNISYKAIFGSYVYYYLPGDLWHITSLQTLPLYLLAGYITVAAMRHAKQLPKLAYVGNAMVLCLLIALH